MHGIQFVPGAGNFQEVERYYDSNLAGTDEGALGSSVAAHETYLLAGAPWRDSYQGSALFFGPARIWNNPGGGQWANAANWFGGSVPEASNSVFFPLPGVYTVAFPVGTAPEIMSLSLTDGFVTFDMLNGGLSINNDNAEGLQIGSPMGMAALDLQMGNLDLYGDATVGADQGGGGILRLNQVFAFADGSTTIGVEGDGILALTNSSFYYGDHLKLGTSGGLGVVEIMPGCQANFDPADFGEYGVTVTNGVLKLEEGYLESLGAGLQVKPSGLLEGFGTVSADAFVTGEINVLPGVPGLGSVELEFFGDVTMLEEDDNGDLFKGQLTTSWDGIESSALRVSDIAALSGLYQLAVPTVNTVQVGNVFTTLTAGQIQDDFDAYLVPYVDSTTYFTFSNSLRGGAPDSIECEVHELAIPFGFNGSVTGPSFTGEARSLEPLDVDDDGDIDLVVLATDTDAGDAICILLNDGGTLCLDSEIGVTSNPVDFDSGDFDDDGDIDLAVTGIQDDELQILENDGTGAYTIAATYPTGNRPIALSVFDWNNDDLVDIALINQDDDTLYVYTNTSSLRSLGFGTPSSTATSEGPIGISPGEVDNPGDKQDDIVVVGGLGEITYHHNTGGAWGPTEEVDTNRAIGGIAVVDLDLDNIDDVLVTYPDDDEAGVHYGPSDDIDSVVLPIDSANFSVIDIDNDGDDDVVGGGGGGPVGRGTIGLRVVRNDTELGSVVFMDVPAGALSGLSSLSTGMLVDGDVYPDLLTVLNDDVDTEYGLEVQTSVNGSSWAPAACAPACEGDSDDSGSVDVGDLLNVIGDWGPCGSGDCLGDINGDDEVNVSDLLLVIANWGSC